MKAVYITSRGGTHPIHKAYAESIGADFQYIDHKMRWHDVPSSRIKRYISWIVCALTFPKRSEYDLFLVSGQHVMPVLMRIFFLLRKNQKLVCFHANEGLFFTYSGKYPKINRFLIKRILPLYDAHICIGDMQVALLKKVTNDRAKNIFKITNGIPKEKIESFKTVTPDLTSHNILFVGNLYTGWRLHYKGVDLMIETVISLYESGLESVKFYMVGKIDESFKQYFDNNVPAQYRHLFLLEGSQKNLSSYYEKCSLYLHCGRGDAFPTTVIESMAAGLPTIVSEWTGTREIVAQVNDQMIVPLDKEKIAEAIREYNHLNINEKEALSSKSKQVGSSYAQEEANTRFITTVEKIMEA